MSFQLRGALSGCLWVLSAVAVPSAALAQPTAPTTQAQQRPTFADLADMADSSQLVVLARIKQLTRVEDARANGLRPGYKRFYMIGETRALLTGTSPIGQTFAYLADLPVDRKDKPTLRKKDAVILFARPVQGRSGELQLVSPNAQVLWNPETEAKVRSIVTALIAPDAPARVTGVRELIYVPGNLAGEGETQIFLNTKDSSAASITVRHQPGGATEWGVSFSELVAELGHPPQPDTLEWYRLACFLPRTPPSNSNMSEGAAERQTADADYRMVLNALGPCRRSA